jgi:DNA polymerase elongation subunit (family B)
MSVDVVDFELDESLKSDSLGGIKLYYSGDDDIVGFPDRNSLISSEDSERIRMEIAGNRPIYFMPIDIEETTVYAKNRAPKYVLHIYGVLENGFKVDVFINDIEPFFDIQCDVRDFGDERGVVSTPTNVEEDPNMNDYLAKSCKIETVRSYPIRGFNETPVSFKRIYFRTLKDRKEAIIAATNYGYITASDDRSSYYRKVAREKGLPLSDWAILRNYSHAEVQSPLCEYTFMISVNNYKPLIDSMAAAAERATAAAIKAANPLLTKDRTLVMTWDIETYSARRAGDLPTAHHPEDNCFMICGSVHWKDDPHPLSQFCISDVETMVDPRWITIVARAPAQTGASVRNDAPRREIFTNVLKAFALCYRAFAPDIICGFNDSNYDWNFVVEKAKYLGIIDWMFTRMTCAPRYKSNAEAILEWNFVKDKRIKISAEESFFSNYLKIPGCVPIDVRVCFKKLFPKSETPKAGSLKFYLEISGLDSKADMPITRMWKIYEAALAATTPQTAAEMRHVAHYCVIDAVRCQELMVRRSIISDYREVSTLAFVSLFDSHYYAGGMKVCNLLGAYAWRRNVLISMISKGTPEGGKYPGAYVFPPEKGISPNSARLSAIEEAAAEYRNAAEMPQVSEKSAATQRLEAAFEAFATDRPVTGLDFSSLYPSLIMTYNFSPEKFISDQETADRYIAAGKQLHYVKFPFNGRDVCGWFVAHDNVATNIGLYPSVLIDLFAKRAEMKVGMGVHGANIELIDIIYGRGGSVDAATSAVYEEARAEFARTAAALAPDAPPPVLSPGSTIQEEMNDMRRLNKNAAATIATIDKWRNLVTLHGTLSTVLEEVYKKAKFEYGAANAKQNALKVYMNTFYGEAGNSISPFFLLQLAGGVTSSGQRNIKLVADFVKSKGFHIKYGDTDSLYLVAPNKYFRDCDMDFATGKLTRQEWMSAMVRITIRALNQIRDEVNERLYLDNGSKYLKMAYEEVLYPVVFTGKKKYFGIPHLNEVNFAPKKLFIRGIDVVKQGQSGLAVSIGYSIMWACMRLDNNRSLDQIVQDILKDAVLRPEQWNDTHFIKTDAYKPDKKNVAVQTFVARMRVQHAMEVRERELMSARSLTSAHSLMSARADLPQKPYLYEIPEPGERFQYVITKPKAMFNIRGCKITPRKGDLMEFYRNVVPLKLEIDTSYYMIKYVVGLCARFINGSPMFEPPGAANMDEKKIDELSQEAAKKFLENFIKSLGDSAIGSKQLGLTYRKAFREAVKLTKEALVETVGWDGAEILHGESTNVELFLADDVNKTVMERVAKYVEDYHAADITEYASIYIENIISHSDIFKLSATKTRMTPLDHMLRRITRHDYDSELSAIMPAMTDLAHRYEADIENFVRTQRLVLTSGEVSPVTLLGVTPADKKLLSDFKDIWYKLVGVKMAELQIKEAKAQLGKLRKDRLKITMTPKEQDVERRKALDSFKPLGGIVIM